MNRNDAIRDKLLKTLYEIHEKARSPSSAAKGIRDIHKAVRGDGLKQQDVAHNLDYLVQKGWVAEDRIPRTFRTKAGTVQNSEQKKYKISDVGIDRLESASTFQRNAHSSGINVTNISGVTVVGNDNVVNSSFLDASNALNDLSEAIRNMDSLKDQTRLEAISDLETIQCQLQKPDPNAGVIEKLWSGLRIVANMSGAIDLYERCDGLLKELFTKVSI